MLEATKQLRLQFDIITVNKRANADGTVEFVGGHSHRRSAQVAEVYGQFAGDLSRVGMQRHTPRCADGGQFSHGLQDAGFILTEYRGDEGGVRPQQMWKCVCANDAMSINWDFFDIVALMLEFVGERGDALVLNCGDDQVGGASTRMVACRRSLQEASNCEVIGFRAAAGEEYAVVVTSAEQFTNTIAGGF